jgi:signal transduction histidine kinase
MGVRSRLTIRVRLTALAVLIVAIGLVVGSVIILALVEDNLLVGAENAARQQAADTAALVAAGDPRNTVNGRLVQVVDRAGTVIAASPELRERPPLLPRWPSNGLLVETVTAGIGGESGDYLVVAVPTMVDGRSVAVYAASSLDTVTEGVDAAASALLIAVPALLGVLGWACWLLVGRTLRPVEAMRRQVAEITAEDLDRRVPEPVAADELGRLAGTMNAMLARLQQAHELQRRFAGDAAHELRSPLAAMLAQLEVGLAHPGATDWVRLAREVHREGTRLDRLTDELLALSRVDGDRPVEPVDLDELVLSEVDSVRARGKVTVDLSALSAVRLPGHPNDLRRVIRNLLDNAERHAATMVTVGLTASTEVAELIVADDGQGIPAPDRERVFDRFHRLQPARDRDTGGAGLGLAIARTIVLAHAGTIWVADSPTGAELHVRLPLTAAE